jgi:hypothetical protein
MCPDSLFTPWQECTSKCGVESIYARLRNFGSGGRDHEATSVFGVSGTEQVRSCLLPPVPLTRRLREYTWLPQLPVTFLGEKSHDEDG